MGRKWAPLANGRPSSPIDQRAPLDRWRRLVPGQLAGRIIHPARAGGVGARPQRKVSPINQAAAEYQVPNGAPSGQSAACKLPRTVRRTQSAAHRKAHCTLHCTVSHGPTGCSRCSAAQKRARLERVQCPAGARCTVRAQQAAFVWRARCCAPVCLQTSGETNGPPQQQQLASSSTSREAQTALQTAAWGPKKGQGPSSYLQLNTQMLAQRPAGSRWSGADKRSLMASRLAGPKLCARASSPTVSSPTSGPFYGTGLQA